MDAETELRPKEQTIARVDDWSFMAKLLEETAHTRS
jgi:hypothetical protein